MARSTHSSRQVAKEAVPITASTPSTDSTSFADASATEADPVVSCGDDITGMEEWVWLGVPAPLVKGLHSLGFKVPTPIQKQAIAKTMKTNRDIIGAAETVSLDL